MGALLGLQNPSAIRRADVLLRTNGGRNAYLRMPAPAASANDAEQLGLATPEFNDIELAPVAFHKANSVSGGGKLRLLISASAVQTVLGASGFDSADVLFETATGVLIDEVLYEIVNSFSSQAMGEAYCYWLELLPPVR
jgi:hypothetical protein